MVISKLLVLVGVIYNVSHSQERLAGELQSDLIIRQGASTAIIAIIKVYDEYRAEWKIAFPARVGNIA